MVIVLSQFIYHWEAKRYENHKKPEMAKIIPDFYFAEKHRLLYPVNTGEFTRFKNSYIFEHTVMKHNREFLRRKTLRHKSSEMKLYSRFRLSYF